MKNFSFVFGCCGFDFWAWAAGVLNFLEGIFS